MYELGEALECTPIYFQIEIEHSVETQALKCNRNMYIFTQSLVSETILGKFLVEMKHFPDAHTASIPILIYFCLCIECVNERSAETTNTTARAHIAIREFTFYISIEFSKMPSHKPGIRRREAMFFIKLHAHISL